MILYEVNLSISKDIFSEFNVWLKPHVEEILGFKGFKHAHIFHDQQNDNPHFVTLIVQYEIASIQDLDEYLEKHAPRMRADGVNRFGNKFSATRRILHLQQSLKK